MPLSTGARLGPYEIVELLGRGGMGEVYRARDTRLGREVAVKVLGAFAADADRLRRFEQEARAAASLSHPNILAVYDVGDHDGVPYVVSELLEGRTLRDELARGALPPTTAIAYGLQIASGLRAAHQKGIVHRDLKPDNLFLGSDGRVTILDFGLARLIEPHGDLTRSIVTVDHGATQPGVVLGTAGYMSPEQVRGVTADTRADVFSFGAVFYEMLTGRRAFSRASAIDTMMAVVDEEPAPIELRGAGHRADITQFVARCLAKPPEKRFPSASELCAALADIDRTGQADGANAGLGPGRLPRAVAFAAAAIVIVAALVFGWRAFRPRGAVANGPIQSLAVLPLDNYSKLPDEEYFSDGMTEALIAELSQMGMVRVISRASVMQFKGTTRPLADIANTLHVDAVVEGSVLQAGDRVRITAQLIDTRSDRHLWARSYERDARDILALQREVAQAITREIESKVTPSAVPVAAPGPSPVRPESHQAYLKGRYYLNKGGEDNLQKAIASFNQAIQADPTSPRGYAGLADAYINLSSWYVAPRQAMPKARAAASKALEIDDALAEAHSSLGYVKAFYEYDWPGAEHELKRALDLNPNLADPHDRYALMLTALGRHDDAIAEVRRAEDLDPLSLVVLGDSAWIFYCARQFERAAGQSRKAIDLDATYWPAYTYLGLALEKLMRFDEAIAMLEKARTLDASPTILEMLGGAYAAAGKRAQAQKVLDDLTTRVRANQRYVCPYEVATVYMGLGDKDSTLAWLQKAYDERADCMPWAAVDSKLDPLRSIPRFRELVARAGLTP
jgi:TolB-like protein/Flp pilus assembly protein TadD